MAEATGSATLKVGEVVIQKPKGTGGKSLVYAVGTVTNLAQAQRFGVKVVLSLHKRDGEKVGENTSDIKSMLEPGETWKFFAPVHEPTAVTAKLVKIEEDRN